MSGNKWRLNISAGDTTLYNVAAEKYLDVSSSSQSVLQASNTNKLNFKVHDTNPTNFIIKDKTNATYLTIDGTSAGVATSLLGGYSAFIYKRISTTYSTTPGSGATTHAVNWNINGVVTTDNVTTCEGVSMPSNPSALGCSTNFVGWSNRDIGGVAEDEAPEDLFTTADGVYIDQDTTFYAVFATRAASPSSETSITTTLLSTPT